MKNRIFTLVIALLAAIVLCACAPNQPTTTAGTTINQLPQPPASQHVDADGDEICDECGIDVTVDIDFYAFNDLHGVFCDTSDNPGVDELTTYLKNAYADDTAYEVVLSSGDMWQGSVESSTNKGQLMTEWMNEVGFVSMTLGNHEYDWGSANIASNAALADFPFLAINLRDSNADEPYWQSSVVVERGGVKIGIIGAVSDWKSSISGEFNDGLEFITGSELTALVKAEAVRLRQEGCHFIVYSIHDGQSNSYYNEIRDITTKMGYYDVELSEGYIDLVFEGHSHQAYVLRDKNGVYHLQGGGYNSGLSYASVCYNLVTNEYQIRTVSTLDDELYADASLEDDAVVARLYEKYFSEEDPYADVLGRNDVVRNSNEIAKTVAQLYWQKGKELWGDQYDIVLGGGFIKTRTPYDLSAGNVTYSQLYSLLPFDNSLVLCQVTGQQLRNKLIGASKYFCAFDDSLRSSIVDDQLYYIVTDTYTSFYKNNMFTEVARLENCYARDLLGDYIAAGNWGGQTQSVTIAQANAIGGTLKDNETTDQIYEITGRVSQVADAYWGNVYLEDEAGERIYLYGLYDLNGVRYDKMEDPPQVGDTITVTGAITRYIDWNGDAVIEIQKACLQDLR